MLSEVRDIFGNEFFKCFRNSLHKMYPSCLHCTFNHHLFLLCLPFTWPSSEYEDKVYVSATPEQCEEYEFLLTGDLQGKRASTGLCQGELDPSGAGCHGLLSLT